jgi:sugar phosphate isomerase/epimerase
MRRCALQLYSVRELDWPLPVVLDRVATAGYDGVEFADRIHEADTAAVADRLEETGLTAVSAHVSLQALETRRTECLALCEQLDCRTLVLSHLPAAALGSEHRIARTATRLQRLQRQLGRQGVRLHYHNQCHEFRRRRTGGVLDRLATTVRPDAGRQRTGRPTDRARRAAGTVCDFLAERATAPVQAGATLEDTAFDALVTQTSPSIGFQVDVGSVVGAGFDPVEVLETYASRIQTVHLADVVVDEPGPMATVDGVSPGEGRLDVDAVIAAADRTGVDWLIYENDSPDDPTQPLSHGPGLLETETQETSGPTLTES